MRRSIWLWLLVAVLAVFGSAFAWFWFSGGSGEPSTELTTPTIVGQSTTSLGAESAATTTFVIQAEQSEASFTLDEVLRGAPQTVVGVTSEVAGQFVLDSSDLSNTQFSAIVVNARTFSTGSSTRDRAIRGPIILNSAADEFEFITFEVTSVSGLEGTAQVGDTLTFLLAGNLTIRGVTNPAEFEVTATLTDDSTVTGTASTTVLRSNYDIGIPSVASVADVTDEVLLELSFIATTS